MNRSFLLGALAGALVLALHAQPVSQPAPSSRESLAAYFKAETAVLAARGLPEIASRSDWESRRGEFKRQAAEMLGLWPPPERADLKAVVTGRIDHEQCRVENLHFQSRPGLYVTANLYLPKTLTKPAPAILYVCGHGPVVSNGVSYGNKVSYQHHGIWFARHGYVCLVIDTVQLGEIQGRHHGTYREGQWWWNSRGYTPAGVEAWAGIRALDYLATRPEADPARFGVTGRSGGGSYSWTIAALDDRIRAAAPVAGLTDLQNHIVDGCVEGHCDCMFLVNTYRWDYPLLAALTAPRPLLLVNSDADTIFPLDGVVRTYTQLRRAYAFYGQTNRLGLVIGPGPHQDTQDLQVPVMRWFNRHLKGEDPLVETAAVKLFAPAQLKVFAQLPADQLNTTIESLFVPQAPVPGVPASPAQWASQRETWLRAVRQQCFAGWPGSPPPLQPRRLFSAERDGLRFEAVEFQSQSNVALRLYRLQRAGLTAPERVTLRVLGEEGQLAALNRPQTNSPGKTAPVPAGGPADLLDDYDSWLAVLRNGFAAELVQEIAGQTNAARAPEAARQFAALRETLLTNPECRVFLAPRGVGLTAWGGDLRQQTHMRRRFMLLGQTLEGMRVWDISRAAQAVRELPGLGRPPLWLEAGGDQAANALYASLFESGLAGLELRRLPQSHVAGPDYLNILKILDISQALAMAAERAPVRLRGANPPDWAWPAAVARQLQWPPGNLRLDP